MYYLIRETLIGCASEAIASADAPYVAILTPEEWRRDRERFAMGIDIESEPAAAEHTRAVVNYDSLTGSIAIPHVGHPDNLTGAFSFALDEKGVVFIPARISAFEMPFFVASTFGTKMPRPSIFTGLP